MSKFHNLPEVIRPRDLPLATGLSRTTCWRLAKDPSSGFPNKIRLSANAVGYFRHEIEAYLKSRQDGAVDRSQTQGNE
jgi:predicted DNA-binding transcriptional regulator AlpA